MARFCAVLSGLSYPMQSGGIVISSMALAWLNVAE
jgi:hypothetical protein